MESCRRVGRDRRGQPPLPHGGRGAGAGGAGECWRKQPPPRPRTPRKPPPTARLSTMCTSVWRSLSAATRRPPVPCWKRLMGSLGRRQLGGHCRKLPPAYRRKAPDLCPGVAAVLVFVPGRAPFGGGCIGRLDQKTAAFLPGGPGPGDVGSFPGIGGGDAVLPESERHEDRRHLAEPDAFRPG